MIKKKKARKAKTAKKSAQITPLKKWTLMVYLAGNNNLAEEMVFALREMYRVGADRDFHVTVQFDTGGPPVRFEIDKLNGRGKPVLASQRLAEDQDFDLKADKVRKPGKFVSTQDLLRDFLNESMKKYQADHYMLVLSGHGSGAVGDFLPGEVQGSQLSIPDLGLVLGQLKTKIDILGMDSCLMSMVEVAYEVQQSVQVMIGAEGFETNTGWPYARLLEVFTNPPASTNGKSAYGKSADAVELAKEIVRQYINYYGNYTLVDLSTDQSALYLASMNNFVRSLQSLASTLRERLERIQGDEPDRFLDRIVMSHWEAQSYKDEQYVDLWDFCDRLSARCKNFDEDVSKLCLDLRNAIYDPDTKDGLALISGYCGAAFQHSHGVSIFFPWANVVDAEGTSDLQVYKTLKLAKETQWDEFLQAYLEKSQRQPRPCDGVHGRPQVKKKVSRLNHKPGSLNTLAVKFSQPEGRFSQPEGRFSQPEGRFSQPEGRFSQPEGRFSQPEGRFSQPEGRFSQPEGRFSQPEGRFSQPEGRATRGKLGEMKNPPIEFFPCKPVETESEDS